MLTEPNRKWSVVNTQILQNPRIKIEIAGPWTEVHTKMSLLGEDTDQTLQTSLMISSMWSCCGVRVIHGSVTNGYLAPDDQTLWHHIVCQVISLDWKKYQPGMYLFFTPVTKNNNGTFSNKPHIQYEIFNYLNQYAGDDLVFYNPRMESYVRQSQLITHKSPEQSLSKDFKLDSKFKSLFLG